MRSVSAMPADLPQESQIDPERILRVLPERERATFLDEYERAVNEARDPAGWKHLNRFLRLWAMRAIAVSEPDYYQARDRARAGDGDGMLLDDAVRARRSA